MAKKVETNLEKKDYSVRLVERSENITPEEVLNNMSTEVIPLIKELVGKGVVSIKGRIELAVHNEHVKDAESEEDYDYTSYVYLTDEGESYYTSSESFDSSFRQLQAVMLGMGLDGSVKIEVIEKKSNNNQGSMLLAKASF